MMSLEDGKQGEDKNTPCGRGRGGREREPKFEKCAMSGVGDVTSQ